MNKLYAGFARVNITPMLGIGLAGYFKTRVADGVLDDLEINALALVCGEDKVVLLSVDHVGMMREITTDFRAHISEMTGLPMEAIYIHATHTHTGPFLVLQSEDELEREYYQMVRRKIADVTKLALDDLKPAKMGWGIGQAPDIAFIRRFRMKDGSVRTNPGVNNPEIVSPIGEVDERVSVIRFDREGADTLVLVNFADHPDTVGGCRISADWPGFVRRFVEAEHGVDCLLVNGFQGDVNHINVNAKANNVNGFDGVPRRYDHTCHMANVVAGAVLQVFGNVNYTDVDSLRFLQRTANLPSNMPKPEDMPLAREYNRLHNEGRDDLIPFTGMELTTAVAEAGRMLRLEHGPEFFPLGLGGIALGNISFVAIPGEPFTGIGLGLKKAEDWTLVLPMCLTNGCDGYFPMQDSYDEGGYEARSSNYRAGVAEQIIEEGLQLLKELR